MPRVLLIATGDVIAFGERGLLTAADLLARLPPGAAGPSGQTSDVTPVDVLTEPAFDMSSSTMLTLARRIRTAVLDDGYDGVVVTHGLDTVEETAFLTDLLAGPAAARAGIVFTGAVRRPDDLAPDGPRNLAAALVAARDPALRLAGPVLCVDDDLHAARWATRIDATAVAGFSSAPSAPLGRVVGDRVEPLATPPPRPPRAAGEPASDVALVKTYPGMEATMLTAVVDAGAAGVVIEGTGNGNVPTSLLAAISDLTEWGIPVVVASRCAGGVAGDPLSIDGLAATVGAIGARGLAAPKARLALMVALGSGNIAGVRRWFESF
jgi:L-asparaginase